MHLIHILEVEWVIADCIMDLTKHFSLFVCSDCFPLVMKRFENVFFQKRILYSILRALIYSFMFRHAKRTQINADDVLLLARKSSTLVRGNLLFVRAILI